MLLTQLIRAQVEPGTLISTHQRIHRLKEKIQNARAAATALFVLYSRHAQKTILSVGKSKNLSHRDLFPASCPAPSALHCIWKPQYDFGDRKSTRLNSSHSQIS